MRRLFHMPESVRFSPKNEWYLANLALLYKLPKDIIKVQKFLNYSVK